MRVYPLDLFLSGGWAFLAWLAIPQTGWEPVFLGVAVVLGVLIGTVQTLPVLRGLDKKQEYQASRMLVVSLIVAAGLLGALFSGILPKFPSSLVGSLYLSIPIGYATAAALFLMWENKRGREVHFAGVVIGRFYTVQRPES